MRPGPWLLVAGDAAGLLALVIFVGHPNFRHPGLTSVTRRLIDAVDADSHPMKLIRGTHDNVYYSYKERSFEPAFARAQGEEVSLTGGAGDGYCFDTNSIHAGSLDGRKARYVVVVEFHSGIIEDAFSRHGLHFRSPFGLR